MKVYTDASFDDKNKIAGIGVCIVDGYKQRTYAVWTKARTINEAELFAIHLGSILSEGKGVIYTDSQTAISYINNQVKEKPRTQEQWLNHKYCQYWAYQIRKRKISVEKIKGHLNHFQTHQLCNNMADILAKAGRAKFYER